jgi:hypothetical protein
MNDWTIAVVCTVLVVDLLLTGLALSEVLLLKTMLERMNEVLLRVLRICSPQATEFKQKTRTMLDEPLDSGDA